MKLYLGESLGLVGRTMPFVLMRAALYGLFGLGAVVYFAFVALFLKILGGAGGGLGVLILLIATGGLIAVARFLRQAVFYALKAGHIAVISELVHAGSLPPGVNQVAYGKDKVVRRFKDVGILFVVDRLVDGVLRSFNRTFVNIADWLPIPGLEGLARLVTTLVNFSVTFIDEAILSYAFGRDQDNLWASARDGVILYVQCWKPILAASAVMGLVNAAAFLAVFIPLALVLGMILPWGLLAVVLAAVLAYLVKLAFVGPWAMAAIILTYHREIQGLEPDPTWEGRLESASGKFRELKEKAVAFTREQAASRGAQAAP